MKVKVESFRGSLRLRWNTPQGRKSLALGIPDTPSHRAYAQTKASQIALDLLSDNYDPSLLKYRPQTLGKQATEISCPELFKRFTAHQFKEKGLAPGSRWRYTTVERYLSKRLDRPAHQVNSGTAGDSAAYLSERLSGVTAKTYLYLVSAAWDWAKGRYHVADPNPWAGLAVKVKTNPQQGVKPFTAAEVTAIIGAFRSSPHYCHYADFVYFLFGVGCRFGEAAGLRWCHVADDFATVWIGESVSRGHRKGTKTGKARTVVLPRLVSDMLKDRRQAKLIGRNAKPDDLVFPSPKGLPIDDHNFRNRAWKTILEQCHIEYRKPYATRHTAISHALANGADTSKWRKLQGTTPRSCTSITHQ